METSAQPSNPMTLQVQAMADNMFNDFILAHPTEMWSASFPNTGPCSDQQWCQLFTTQTCQNALSYNIVNYLYPKHAIF